MSLARCVALSALLAAAAHVQAGPPQRYFDLINTSHDSAVSVEVSSGDDAGFQRIDIGRPLRGGHHTITLEAPGATCVRDFRIGFNDGRVLLYPNVDVCRHGGLQLTPRDGA